MGLIPACDDAEKAYDSKKVIGRLFSRELADDPSARLRGEKRPPVTLPKGDMLALRTKMTDSP
eukprot:CCRYP_011214-RA/>CCRYP_011214-RA protein AED:0.44 eAED:0.44 QI:0/-1/0/1/-1/1/1/0/62